MTGDTNLDIGHTGQIIFFVLVAWEVNNNAQQTNF